MRQSNTPSGMNPRTYAAQQISQLAKTSGLRVGDPLPSYRELARRIKVSLMTVERAMEDLAQEGLITSVDRKGAFLVRQLGPSAHELRTIGLLSASTRSSLVALPYRSEILLGLLESADSLKADFQIFSFHLKQGHISPADIVRVCDGVIVLGAVQSSVLTGFVKEHLPMVVVDFITDRLPVHHIVVDNAAFVCSAVSRLLADRHEHLIYVREQPTAPVPNHWIAADSDHNERLEAFQTIMRERGCDWKIVGLQKKKNKFDISPLVEMLASNKQRPTGLVIEDTTLASNVLLELETQTRLQAPRDLSIVSVAGARHENVVPGHIIAHHEAHFVEMGERAVASLQERCNSLRPTKRTIERMGADFIPGDTLGAAPTR